MIVYAIDGSSVIINLLRLLQSALSITVIHALQLVSLNPAALAFVVDNLGQMRAAYLLRPVEFHANDFRSESRGASRSLLETQ